MEINFIVLSPEPNIGRLKGTVRSIKNNYSPKANIICCVEKGCSDESLKEMGEVCKIYKGGSTITSLINKGMKYARQGWNMLVMEGVWIPRNITRRYETWIGSEKDVFFPVGIYHEVGGVVDNFVDCSLNGILMDRDFFSKVGKMSDNPLNISKLFWMMDAMENGASFKGVLGIRMC